MTTITVETYPDQEQYYADLASAQHGNAYRVVNLDHVVERSNYRQAYNQNLIETIAGNMAEHGFNTAEPLEVYIDPVKGFVIIDGHTRHKAALLGSAYSIKTHKPLLDVCIVIKPKPTDGDFYLMQYTANNNRQQPDEISNATALRAMLDHGKTMSEIMIATGHTKDYIDRRLALLTLVTDVQELVSKGQLGISFAYALRDLDSNRQRIAVRHYNTRKPLLEDFIKFCSELHEQQIKDNEANQLFSLQALEMIADTIADKIGTESRKSRADLEAENKALRATLEADRQFAIEYAKKQAARIMALSQQLAALQNSTAQTQAA